MDLANNPLGSLPLKITFGSPCDHASCQKTATYRSPRSLVAALMASAGILILQQRARFVSRVPPAPVGGTFARSLWLAIAAHSHCACAMLAPRRAVTSCNQGGIP